MGDGVNIHDKEVTLKLPSFFILKEKEGKTTFFSFRIKVILSFWETKPIPPPDYTGKISEAANFRDNGSYKLMWQEANRIKAEAAWERGGSGLNEIKEKRDPGSVLDYLWQEH